MSASSSRRLPLSKAKQLKGRKRMRTKAQVRRAKPRAVSATKRTENAVVRKVMADIEPRDGACVVRRLDFESQQMAGPCGGPTDPMHLGEWRRAKTRKMPADQRHNRRTILRGCRGHHRAYDAHAWDIAYERDKGAEGVLLIVPYVKGETPYLEAA